MTLVPYSLASFNYPEHAWIMLLGLPLVVPMPVIMLWLVLRSFRYSEPQSARVIIALIAMLGINVLYHNPFRPFHFTRHIGFFDVWLVLMRLAFFATPIALVWEAYKHGLFRAWRKKKRKSKKKRSASAE